MEPGSGWLVSGGSVWSMVVVVDVAGPERFGAVSFAAAGVGVEELLGQDSIVALDFPVVSGCVGRGALVPGSAQHGGEVGGAVAGPVVGHDPLNMRDAMRGEELRLGE